jgi:hypothetical protein
LTLGELEWIGPRTLRLEINFRLRWNGVAWPMTQVIAVGHEGQILASP